MSWKYLAKIGLIAAILVMIGSVYHASVLVSVIDDVDIGTGDREKKEAETEKKKIALTFDDGPSEYTEKLLEGLKEREVNVTFFVLGKCAEVYPEIVKREAMEGHIVGNHTYDHEDIGKMNVESAYKEVTQTNQILLELTETLPQYIRPPFGEWNKNLDQKIDMIPVLWSVDPLDWATENEDKIVNNVVTEVEDGDIILLHDSSISSVNAALRIIDILEQSGYEFVTVEELILN